MGNAPSPQKQTEDSYLAKRPTRALSIEGERVEEVFNIISVRFHILRGAPLQKCLQYILAYDTASQMLLPRGI